MSDENGHFALKIKNLKYKRGFRCDPLRNLSSQRHSKIPSITERAFDNGVCNPTLHVFDDGLPIG